ncbi:MAG: (2Fe-2S)-binding protein [Chloroflexota bacterium]
MGPPGMTVAIELRVNGQSYPLHVRTDDTLLEVLRYRLGLLGTKENCLKGECGVCTVLLDGANVYSCLVLAVMAQRHAITTVEGLNAPDLTKAFLRHGAVQCGYCTPGMLVSAEALLQRSPDITEVDIRAGLAGNLCRCTGYAKIVDAVQAVADARRAEVSAA